MTCVFSELSDKIIEVRRTFSLRKWLFPPGLCVCSPSDHLYFKRLILSVSRCFLRIEKESYLILILPLCLSLLRRKHGGLNCQTTTTKTPKETMHNGRNRTPCQERTEEDGAQGWREPEEQRPVHPGEAPVEEEENPISGSNLHRSGG